VVVGKRLHDATRETSTTINLMAFIGNLRETFGYQNATGLDFC